MDFYVKMKENGKITQPTLPQVIKGERGNYSAA